MPIYEDENRVFFYGRDSMFSQFYPCRFVDKDLSFTCAEQYMHYTKAELFGDKQCSGAIINTKSPIQHKRLGRKVRHFSETVWYRQCKSIVKKGTLLKFKQNRALKQHLLDTHPKQLVEASPFDMKWGIGLPLSHPNIHDPSQWRGENMLGQILTEVREELYTEIKGHSDSE
jgi:ribA/ribD-fused uncharacterized protein